MPHLALLVSHPSYAFAAEAYALADQYLALFRRHGLELALHPWTDGPPDLPTMASIAWGYHLDIPRWQNLLDDWPDRVPVINAPTILRWNTDKLYLAELEAAGIATVPTHFVAKAGEAELAAARAEFATSDLVVKPRISAAGHLTGLIGRTDPAPDLPGAMIQPFLPSVRDEGERSLFFFDGIFSHAVRKVARGDEIRVQKEYGGAYSAYDPRPATVDLARRAIALSPGPPVYARVDIVSGPSGEPLVMELELLEPDLYFDYAPDRGDAFVAAVRRAFDL